MNRRFRVSVVSLFCAMLAMLSTPVGTTLQSDEDGRALPAKDWTHYGGDWTSARYSTLTAVNTDNVKTLGAAWSMTFEASASTRAAPVVKDGMMFISAGSRLYALNAKTGERMWTWRPSEKAPARLERSEEHTSELQSLRHLVCRLLLE